MAANPGCRADPGHGGDKEWFTIDKTGGTGHGFQYQFWTGFFACDTGEFTRSTDGGVTWMTPINVPNNADTGALDVDTNGNLFLAGGGSPFYCIRSSNAQIGGQTPTFDQTTQVNLGGDLIQGGINGIGLCGQTFVAVDRSGTATNNNIYVLASVEPFSANNGTDVMFARSTDDGQTFSAPHRINDDPINPNKWHIFGTLSVAPNGRIDVVWLDTRNAANNTDCQLFYSWSTDGGVTWAPNVAVSNSFNPQAGFPQQSEDRRLHHDCIRQYRRQRGVCGYLQRQPERRRRARTRRLLRARFPIRWTYAYADSHTDRHSFCDTKCNANCYSDADNYAQCYTDTHGYSYSTANTDASNEADAESSSYSATEAQSVTL